MRDYFAGSVWSKTYAKRALPILVNLAEDSKSTTYSELATVMLNDKKYAHPLMSALGRLGYALEGLEASEPKKFGKIPPIQLLVCNESTGRPGNLALSFLGLKKSETDKMSEALLDTVVSRAHQRVFAYQHWQSVLKAFQLKPVKLELPAPETLLPKIGELEGLPKGEGAEHQKLKSYLARNPHVIGIDWAGHGDTERLLLSGDRLDISFRDDERWIAVEVKGKNSPVADLVRGTFQCIKYKVILESQLRYEALVGPVQLKKIIPRMILACGGSLPSNLLAFAKSRGVEVRSDVLVP